MNEEPRSQDASVPGGAGDAGDSQAKPPKLSPDMGEPSSPVEQMQGGALAPAGGEASPPGQADPAGQEQKRQDREKDLLLNEYNMLNNGLNNITIKRYWTNIGGTGALFFAGLSIADNNEFVLPILPVLFMLSSYIMISSGFEMLTTTYRLKQIERMLAALVDNDAMMASHRKWGVTCSGTRSSGALMSRRGEKPRDFPSSTHSSWRSCSTWACWAAPPSGASTNRWQRASWEAFVRSTCSWSRAFSSWAFIRPTDSAPCRGWSTNRPSALFGPSRPR